jgi:hypothetical protein
MLSGTKMTMKRIGYTVLLMHVQIAEEKKKGFYLKILGVEKKNLCREARLKEELEKYRKERPKLQTQFADLKQKCFLIYIAFSFFLLATSFF